jgi:hypothetical protein
MMTMKNFPDSREIDRYKVWSPLHHLRLPSGTQFQQRAELLAKSFMILPLVSSHDLFFKIFFVGSLPISRIYLFCDQLCFVFVFVFEFGGYFVCFVDLMIATE